MSGKVIAAQNASEYEAATAAREIAAAESKSVMERIARTLERHERNSDEKDEGVADEVR
jgi:hypothetical protein